MLSKIVSTCTGKLTAASQRFLDKIGRQCCLAPKAPDRRSQLDPNSILVIDFERNPLEEDSIALLGFSQEFAATQREVGFHSSVN